MLGLVLVEVAVCNGNFIVAPADHGTSLHALTVDQNKNELQDLTVARIAAKNLVATKLAAF